MFYSRISSDAVLPNLEIGFNFHNEPTPAGDFWFATVAALRNSVPSDFTSRLLTASLMLHYGADDTSAAAALIADNFFLVTLPGVPAPVRLTAQRFTQRKLPNLIWYKTPGDYILNARSLSFSSLKVSGNRS